MPTSRISDGATEAASGPAGSGSPAGPGGRLRQAREAQGLQLEEIANELRVSAAALAALEENRFEALGAAVFARGYLKQYGTRLGLDPRDLLALYERSVDESEIALAPTKGIRLRDERQISLWVVATIALGVVVGGLSYWWWSQSNVESGPTTANVESESGAPIAAVPPDDAAASTEADSVEADAAAADSAAAGAATGAAREPADDPVQERADGIAAAAPAATSSVAANDPAPAATAPRENPVDPGPAAAVIEPPRAIEGRVLEVTFIEDSWAEITAGDGSRLYYNLGRAGTRARFPADRDLNIYFGRASGVELRVEGEVVPLPRAAPNGVVSFDLDDVID